MNKINFTLTMEPETIQNNGARPKSQTSRRNRLRYAICAVLAGAAVFSSCNSQPQITMTTEAGRVDMMLGGFGTATIYWGDGKSDTLALNDERAHASIKHKYSEWSDSRTVTITGTNITALFCPGYNDVNKLTSLDVSKNKALKTLYCDVNQLTALDVSKNKALTTLSFTENELTTLDVSKNTALTHLNCAGNELETLDVSKNTALTQFNCSNNFMDADALNALFGTLHDKTIPKTLKQISFVDNPGRYDCDRSIFKNKGWEIF
jgi:hypothetical protein